ncbi:MAG: cytochrome b/b6 domain-containing protein [Phycisphaerales bacterium]|nr:cytochrome b/b6 domain-containing protein [Phycisphaerales bacterium]
MSTRVICSQPFPNGICGHLASCDLLKHVARKTTVWIFTLFAAQICLAQDKDNCLYCHQFPGLSRFDPASNRARLFYIDPAYTSHSLGPHARLACVDCHARDEVGVIPHKQTTPVDCTRECHVIAVDGRETRFTHAGVARMLEQSAHSAAVLQSLQFHGGPLLAPGQSQCLYCHDEPVFRMPAGTTIHGLSDSTARCDTCHTEQLPVNPGYMLRHVGARLEAARPPLELAQICSTCHSDPVVLAGLKKPDAVASYVRSFHGKAALLNAPDTAGCVDCHVGPRHNAHLMLGSSSPDSSVHEANVADSCIQCHTAADVQIAATSVHLDLPESRQSIDFLVAAAFLFITVISFVPSAVLVVLELGQLVVGRHAHSAQAVHQVLRQVLQHPLGPARLTRFRPSQRLQHWVLSLLFMLLALTGFPMKFADQRWAASVIDTFGGLGRARDIHHWSGVALVVGFALHLFVVMAAAARKARVPGPDGRPPGLIRTVLNLPMVMSPIDLKKWVLLMAYLVGLRRERPMFGRFSAGEKFEYFGVLWGTTLLGITGFMLWGEQITSHFMGGRVFNIAAIVHTYEAFLAVIHVGVLHICNVILAPGVFPLSPATLSGRTPAGKLAEENGEFVLEAARSLGISTEVADSGIAEVAHA